MCILIVLMHAQCNASSASLYSSTHNPPCITLEVGSPVLHMGFGRSRWDHDFARPHCSWQLSLETKRMSFTNFGCLYVTEGLQDGCIYDRRIAGWSYIWQKDCRMVLKPCLVHKGQSFFNNLLLPVTCLGYRTAYVLTLMLLTTSSTFSWWTGPDGATWWAMTDNQR